MNRRYGLLILCLPVLLLILAAQPATAASLDPTTGQWLINFNGVIHISMPPYDGDFVGAITGSTAPPNYSGNPSQFGNITFNLAAGGNYDVVAFWDEALNSGNSTHEFAVTSGLSGTPTAPGPYWEVGYAECNANCSAPGAIVTNSAAGAQFLTNINDFPSATNDGDVSVALGWDIVNLQQNSILTFTQSMTAPTAGVPYIEQTDAAGDKDFFSTTLAPATVPEPGTAWLLVIGLGIVGAGGMKKTRTE